MTVLACRRLLMGSLALLLAVFAGVLVASRPSRTRVAYAQTIVANVPRRLTAPSGDTVLHLISYHANGGVVRIDWYDSDFEPTAPRQTAAVALVVDGRTLATAVKRSFFGTYEDGPGWATWEGALSPGTHTIAAVLVRAHAPWGAPYVDAGFPGSDLLLVTEDGR